MIVKVEANHNGYKVFPSLKMASLIIFLIRIFNIFWQGFASPCVYLRAHLATFLEGENFSIMSGFHFLPFYE